MTKMLASLDGRFLLGRRVELSGDFTATRHNRPLGLADKHWFFGGMDNTPAMVIEKNVMELHAESDQAVFCAVFFKIFGFVLGETTSTFSG
jgi:hypothetical protein